MDIGQGTLSGTGVTMYVTKNGSLNFNKGTLNLTAPTTGDYANMLFYGATLTGPQFNKTTSTITGVVYFPQACINLNKNGGGYTVFVLACANFNKSSMTWPPPPGGGSYIKTPVLAE
jgi:hypothetical protein